MSWTEVKKINGDLSKPLDTLITEKNASLESLLASKNDLTAAKNTITTALEEQGTSLNSLPTSLDKMILQRGTRFRCGHQDNYIYLSNLEENKWITLGEVSGLGYITHGYNYVCLKSLSENNRGMYVRGRLVVDGVIRDYWSVQTITNKSTFVNHWGFTMPNGSTERRSMNPNLEGIGSGTVYWTEISPLIWFQNLKVEIYYYHDSRDLPTTNDYIYRCYFDGIKVV